MDYPQALRWLYGLGGYEARGPEALKAGHFGLERTAALLERLGHPEQSFRSLHVAGTKGKGSTAAMAASILRAADRRTGLYTSPHLTSFRERIRLDGELIPEALVAAGTQAVREAAPEGLTSFEAFTGLALWAFREARLEWAVVEAGLGGRLDSTNVLRPRATAITPIGLEHTQILGRTLTEIAREKAGILKEGVPLALGEQPEEAREAILDRAARLGLRVLEVGRDLQAVLDSVSGGKQIFRVRRGLPEGNYELPLLGAYQMGNALTAMALCTMGAGQLSWGVLRRGLAAARWPGRLEILAERPTVVVDAAHTVESTRALLAALRTYFPQAQLYWIFATLQDKPAGAMLRLIGRASRRVILPPLEHPRAASPKGLAGEPAAGVAEALERALQLAGLDDLVVASGSVAFAGAARLAILRRVGAPLPPVDPPLR